MNIFIKNKARGGWIETINYLWSDAYRKLYKYMTTNWRSGLNLLEVYVRTAAMYTHLCERSFTRRGTDDCTYKCTHCQGNK